MASGGASDHQRATQPAGHSATHCGASKGVLAGGGRQVAAIWAGPAVRSRCYASTHEVAAGVVDKTCERMLSLWEPDLDVEHPPAADAHVGTEECVRTVHRDRCVVDCADTDMQIDLKMLGAPRFMWDPTVSRSCPNPGSHSDESSAEPSELAPPPHSDDMGSAGLARARDGGCCGLWFARGGGAHGY